MKKIAIYGKGGIGKSTVSQNLAVALAEKGQRVMLVGCDPKSDSTRLITGKNRDHTVLNILRNSDGTGIESAVSIGYAGVRCVESGGPEPGVGCAGRGIITAIEALENVGAFDDETDYVIFDVLGDVVCGGFAMPIREGKADVVYIVCSGECQALYAANNIAKGILRFADNSGTRLGGIICNRRNTSNEIEIVKQIADKLNTQLIHTISRDNKIVYAEAHRKTVVEYFPESNAANEFYELADKIMTNTSFSVPTPLNNDEMDKIYDGIWASEAF